MQSEQFEKILADRLEKIRVTLSHKAGEYATDADRLHNFKRAAGLLDVTPEKALVGFLTKHIVSVLDITDGLTGGKGPVPGVRDEKIGDCINYLILLEALLIERRGE